MYAAGSPGTRKKILVAIFQRGAADGLNVVVPHGEKALLRSASDDRDPAADRSGIRTRPSTWTGSSDCIRRSRRSSRCTTEQHLAIVDAVGSPDPTRSHFDAQDYMESGTPGRKAHAGRVDESRAAAAAGKVSPVRARGARAGAAARHARAQLRRSRCRLSKASRCATRKRRGSSNDVYGFQGPDLMQAAGRETFEAVAMLQADPDASATRRPTGADYPRGRFGQSLQQIAQLIKSDVGVEMAFADIGGWDHHVNELGARPSEGVLANLLREFGQSLSAFWHDMGDRMDDVVVVTMSEFGRTARENGNRGTDHGHANGMFVMGGGVQGGKVYGKWPGLEREQLYEGRDLALTTDFRDVLGELVSRHLGNPSLQTVFPGYNPKVLGLV